MLKLHKMIRMSHEIAWPSIFFDVMGEIAREKCSQLLKMIIFQYIQPFGFFSLSFQAYEGVAYIFMLVFELHQMIRVLLSVAFPMNFTLLFVLCREPRVLKIMLFQIFIAFWAFSLTFGVRQSFICAKYDYFDAFILLYILENF